MNRADLPGPLPLPEGRTEVALDPLGQGPPPAAYHHKATLRDIVQDGHVLFHHAALWLCGRLPGDPAEVFYREHHIPDRDRHALVVLPAPLIRGLPVPWDRTLGACPAPIWPSLAQDLGLVGGRGGDWYWYAFRQTQLPVLDLGAIRTAVDYEQPPTVPVEFFGVDSNKGCWHFQLPPHPLAGPILLRRDPPRPETVQIARAILLGEKDPFSRKEKHP